MKFKYLLPITLLFANVAYAAPTKSKPLCGKDLTNVITKFQMSIDSAGQLLDNSYIALITDNNNDWMLVHIGTKKDGSDTCVLVAGINWDDGSTQNTPTPPTNSIPMPSPNNPDKQI
jgi:hypothetical protein